MKKLFILFFLLPIFSKAQNASNNLLVVFNGNFYFNINSIEDMESEQIQNNAITIRVKTRNNNASVYAKLSSYSMPAGAYITSSPVAIKFASSTSSNYQSMNTQKIMLTTVDQFLFTQPKHANNGYKEFRYNFILGPLSYDYNPGNYGFTILFTMTQP